MKYLVVANITSFGDFAIGGGTIQARYGACAWLQGASEEVIKAFEFLSFLSFCLGHIDIKFPYNDVDKDILYQCYLAVGNPANDAGQKVLRGDFL